MDVYDQLAQDPKFSGTDRGNLPAQVSLEWEMNESPRLVTLMVVTVDRLLQKNNTMSIDSRKSIQSAMNQVPVYFALENHPAWLRLMGVSLNGMKHYDTSDVKSERAFEALRSIHQTVASIFDGKVAIGKGYQLQNGVTIHLANKDDLNSFAYYLIYHTQSKKDALVSLKEFVTPQ